MEGKTYGYVRVSAREQNEARQLAAMREFGVAEVCGVPKSTFYDAALRTEAAVTQKNKMTLSGNI